MDEKQKKRRIGLSARRQIQSLILTFAGGLRIICPADAFLNYLFFIELPPGIRNLLLVFIAAGLNLPSPTRS
ncbi:MAG: hypothetical protein EBT43_02125 [Methylocystaceae bacterium]|nr:hypothetical protein [Methylocystaceae bacterium]